MRRSSALGPPDLRTGWQTSVSLNVAAGSSICYSTEHDSEMLGRRLCTSICCLCRLPFEHTLRLEGEGKRSFVLTSAVVIKMKANMADAPYLVEKQQSSRWHFALAYANTDSFLPLAHQCLTACKLPYADRELALTVITPRHSQCVYIANMLAARLAASLAGHEQGCSDSNLLHCNHFGGPDILQGAVCFMQACMLRYQVGHSYLGKTSADSSSCVTAEHVSKPGARGHLRHQPAR